MPREGSREEKRRMGERRRLRSFPRTRGPGRLPFTLSKVGDLCAPAARDTSWVGIEPIWKTPSIRLLRGSCGESRFREAKMRRIPGYRATKASTGTLAALAGALLASACPLQAADVTYERLLNPE